MMNTKSILLATILICVLIVSGCSKKEEDQTGELTQEELTQDSSAVSVLTIKPKPINYDSMLVVVGDLIAAIKSNPDDIELRRDLVAASYDSTWETILSVGFGKPSLEAETESIALKYAERAATADALRWSAYIKRWTIDPTFPDLDSLNVEIQGGKVVAKKVLPDQTVSVLVEIHSSKIL
jgi:hypothetical protein